MNNKRSGKFYRKNEAEVMQQLGFTPTPNSGSGWIVKEDGQTDELICQLKSTDAGTIKVSLQDIQKLEYNAQVSHKLPVFAVQFLSCNKVYLLIAPEDAQSVLELLKTGKATNTRLFDLDVPETPQRGQKRKRKTIGSAANAREAFHAEQQQKFKKERSAK